MVGALEVGADDYVTKPFGIKELLARAKNALRRRAREQSKPAMVTSGDLEIDLLYRRVCLGGRKVHLSPNSYEVLRIFAEGAGKVVTHGQILDAVWSVPRAARIQYLRTAVRELRRTLETDPAHPQHILTETRVGYRLDVRGRPEHRSLPANDWGTEPKLRNDIPEPSGPSAPAENAVGGAVEEER